MPLCDAVGMLCGCRKLSHAHRAETEMYPWPLLYPHPTQSPRNSREALLAPALQGLSPSSRKDRTINHSSSDATCCL